MADTGIFATTAEVQRKVGAGVSATANVEAFINDFMCQAESLINVYCRYNFSDNYSTLNVDVKCLLKEVASNIAAIYVIQYDFTNINSRTEAEDRINVLRDAALRGLAILRDKKNQDFMTGE